MTYKLQFEDIFQNLNGYSKNVIFKKDSKIDGKRIFV